MANHEAIENNMKIKFTRYRFDCIIKILAFTMKITAVKQRAPDCKNESNTPSPRLSRIYSETIDINTDSKMELQIQDQKTYDPNAQLFIHD
jgi:hypothetical protein